MIHRTRLHSLYVGATVLLCLLAPSSTAAALAEQEQATVRIRANGVGTGIVAHVDAARVKILTARHVIAEASSIRVYFRDNRLDAFEATVLHQDVELDLALLEIVLPEGVSVAAKPPLLKLGSDPSVGEQVFALGHAGENLWTPTAKSAVLPGFDLDHPGQFVFPAADLREGYSGGPVFAEDGRVAGVVDQVGADNAYAIPAGSVIAKIRDDWGVTDLNRFELQPGRTSSPFERLQKAVATVQVGESMGSGLIIHQDKRKVMILASRPFLGKRTEAQVAFVSNPTVLVPAVVSAVSQIAELVLLTVTDAESLAALPAPEPIPVGLDPVAQQQVYVVGQSPYLRWTASTPVQVNQVTSANNDRHFVFVRGDMAVESLGGAVAGASGAIVGLAMPKLVRRNELGEIVQMTDIDTNYGYALKISTVVTVLREQLQIREHNLLDLDAPKPAATPPTESTVPSETTDSSSVPDLDVVAEGLAAAKAGNCEEALPHLEIAARTDRRNQRVQLELARCLISAERCADAERALSAALRRDPGNLALLRERAEAYVCLRRDQFAIDDLTSLIDMDSTVPDVLKARGRLYMERGDYQKAAYDFQAAYQLDKSDADALDAFGKAMIENGDSVLGQQAVEAAAKMR